MASENVRKKLKQLLERGSNKATFKEDIKWLQSINSWINFRYPTLQTFVVKGVSLTWLHVYPSPEKDNFLFLLFSFPKNLGFNVFLLTEGVALVSFVLLTGDGCSSELNELKEDNASDDSEESVLSSSVHQLSCVK